MSSANMMEVDSEVKDTFKWFDLIPDRKLLDSNFEGYKLSLETFVNYKLELNDDFKANTYTCIENESTRALFVYQHLKLFGLQNLIIVNQFDDSNIYYFDSVLRLVKLVYNRPKQIPVRAVVKTSFQLPLDSLTTNPDRVNPTLKFLNKSSAIVFNGLDTLFFCEIDSTSSSDEKILNEEKWNVLFEWNVKNLEGNFARSSILKDALFYENHIHVLLMNVQEQEAEKGKKFETLINWLLFEKNSDQSNFTLKRTRRINCFSTVPEYASLETNGQSIYISGPSFIKYIYDSEKRIQTTEILPKKIKEIKNEKSAEKFYSWKQTDDEIQLNVRLDCESVQKNELKVNFKYDSVEIYLREKLILSGMFYSTIKPDESIWTLSNTDNNNTNNLIEFTFIKGKTGEAWISCLKDDKCGEYAVESMVVDQFTSESLAKGNEIKNLFTLEQQLEECDGIIEDQVTGNLEDEEKFLMLRRLDGNTHEATHKTFINDNKFLFELKLNPNKCSALCLRHDVDGILWQPHRVTEPAPSETIWLTHEHTFLAFGYVQASKQDTKFCSSSPNCSYVCIADTQKHIFLYKQSTDLLEAQLKNRKTGKIINNVSKQHLITYDCGKEIYGIYCSNEFLIVLFSDACYFYKI